MDKEIERKFLIPGREFDGSPFAENLAGFPSIMITQVYLSESPCTRIRLISKDSPVLYDRSARLTVKGPGLISRTEIECEIPFQKAKKIVEEGLYNHLISKIRYQVGHWEVDQFLGKHDGFWMAEIELKSEDERFEKPDWLGREVSNDPRYTNLALARDGVPKEKR